VRAGSGRLPLLSASASYDRALAASSPRRSLTLLVIPTVYEILADSRDWLSAKFGMKKADPGHPTEPVRAGH
jgi:hypothetical protein